MGVQRDISSALEQRLAAYTPALPVAYPNEIYSPAIGNSYLKAARMPAKTVRNTIGANGLNEYAGIWQMDVAFPSKGGQGLAETYADGLTTWFYPGLTLTQGTTTVVITAISQMPARTEPDWYTIPIVASYRTTSPL